MRTNRIPKEFKVIRNVKLGSSIIAILLCLPIISHAKALICPFRDKFTLSVPDQVKILSAIPQGNVYYTQKSDNYFELSCAHSSDLSGELFIKIGYDNDNQCSLIVRDGPFELNPSVSKIYCNGTKLAYIGMDHIRGTYDYILKFTT